MMEPKFKLRNKPKWMIPGGFRFEDLVHPRLLAHGKIEARISRILLFSVLTVVASVGYGLIYYSLEMRTALLGAMMSFASSLLAYIVIWRFANPTLAANLLVGGIFLAIFFVSFATGGLHTPALSWANFFVICGATLAGERTGIIWAIVGGLMMVFFYIVSTNGILPPPELPEGAVDLFALIAPLGLLACISILIIYYERLNDKTTRSLKQSKTNIEDTLKNLQHTQERLQQFNFIASHDLQEPLRSISNFAQLLRSDKHMQQSEQAQKYLEIVQGSAGRMRELVKDVLHYSIIEKEREKDKIHCNDLLDKILQDLNIAIRESGAKVMVDELPMVYGNKTQMRLLFQNLLANAIKFRKPDVPPMVKVSAINSGRFDTFCVEDNGIGIDRKYHHKIFDVFNRLHLRDEFEGTGIGLALCKKIIEMHRGRIWVASRPAEGTSIYFTIPKKEVFE